MNKYLKSAPVYLIAALAVLVFYWVYQKLYNPAQRAERQEAVRVSKVANDTMSTGRTYYSLAEEIYSMLYFNWWIFGTFWKNTDEVALGKLLQTVSHEEFPKLSEVYLLYKKGFNAPDENPLLEDLYRTFNEKERTLYLSHLTDTN